MLAQLRTAAALLLVVSAIPATARAQTAWRDAGGNCSYHVLQHQRFEQNAHGSNGCEWVQIEGNGGSYAYFAHDAGRPRVIDELAFGVWIKSDRPGPYLAVRVVLPRTIDPRSGQPVAAILMGAAYTDVGRWQELRLAGIPTLLTRQIHVLRMQLGPQVDDREAYVDAVLLNVYGGPGATNVWIDNLDVAGYAAASRMPSEKSLPVANAAPLQRGGLSRGQEVSGSRGSGPVFPASGFAPLVPVRLPPVPAFGENSREIVPLPPVGDSAPRRTVTLVGSVLLVNDHPMFPRVIQYRGEPLAALKKIGFNTVWLERLPASELLEEADRLGLLLICPPPRALTPMADIGRTFDSVVAWDLGNNLTEADLEPTQRWAEQVKKADRRGNRPLICCPRVDLRGYSRLDLSTILLIDRRPLGTSLSMTDYAAWVRRQPLLARPGTPVWTTVQTQPNEALRQQMVVLEPGTAPPLCVSSEQIQLLAYHAVAAGSRGLVFLSDSPLDTPDPETRQRAMTLELLNLELELMEPWAAAGSVTATADSSVKEVQGAVLHAEHAWLLLPLWSSPMSQCVPPQSAANTLALVVPGVPETNNAYELTPSGVQPLPHERVAGGLRVTLNEFGLTTQVLLAHDPLVISAVNRRAVEVGRRAAELQRDLAARKLNTVQTLAGQLATRTPVADAARWLNAARKDLQICDSRLSAGDAPGTARYAQRAMRSLRLVERAYWDIAVKGLASPVTSPTAVSFETLPFHWRLVARLTGCRFGPSRIAGGDFEDLDTMMRAGWRYIQHSTPSVQTAADLAPDAAHGGRLGLRLAAVAVDAKKPPAVIESPPVLFTSPPVPVEAGQIVCVSGWVRVPAPIAGSSDGLLIVDSLSGEALADRIGQTDGWRQFALYRAAPQSGPMCVTFALSGLGEARLDDVAIQVVEAPAAVSQR